MSQGHPVDVASGELFDLWEDVRIPGRQDVSWTRRYSTGLLDRPGHHLGPGWTANYLATLRRAAGGYVYTGGDGNEIRFEDPDSAAWTGKPVRNLAAFAELRREAGLLVVVKWVPGAHSSERFLFNPGDPAKAWNLHSHESSAGHAVDLGWDPVGRILFARQRRERRGLAFRYNDLGRISEIEVAGDNYRKTLVRYGYDRAGRLVKVDNCGAAEAYEYDDANRLVRETTRSGGVFTFQFDDRGRCVKSVGLDHYFERTFRYMPNGGFTEVVDSLGKVWRYQYLPTGQVERSLSPMGVQVVTKYDDIGRIVEKIDGLGNATKYAYSDAGDYAEITDPLGQATRFEHNDRHLLTKFIDTAGGEWKLEYDPQGRLLSSVDPLGARWRCQLDAQGDIVAVKDALGAERRLQHDARGNLVSQTDWKGAAFAYEYDPLGQMTAKTDPLGRVTKYAWNDMGLVTGIAFPSGERKIFEYDSAGYLAALTEENGAVTRFKWGTCGRLLKQTDAQGRVTRYWWTKEPDRLEKVIDPRGNVHRFEYDDDGRPVKEIDFEGRSLERIFDAAWNPIVLREASGRETAQEFDPLGRLLKKILPDGTETEFAYHPLGALASAKNAAAEIKFERDAVGRVIKETRDGFSVETEYDAIGNRIGRKSSAAGQAHEARFGLDANGRLAALDLDGKWALRFDRDAMGRETSRALPGGAVLTHRYDVQDRLLEQQLSHPSAGEEFPLGAAVPGAVRESMRIHRALRHAPGNAALEVVDARRGKSTWVMDSLGYLTSVARENGRNERFLWDAAGNPASTYRAPAPGQAPDRHHGEQDCEYGPGNLLIRKGPTRFEYDADGRLVRKTELESGDPARVWEFGWDGEGNLAWVRDPENREWKYRYDAFCRRISKEGPGVSFAYGWDGDELLHEVDAAGKVRTFSFDEDGAAPLSLQAGGEIHLYVNDHLGTPQELVRPDGSVSWAAEFSAWGLADGFLVKEVDNPIRFPGQWHDPESGLHYNRFRHYDPSLGRYLSPDPLGIAEGLNSYQYAPSPSHWRDPFGLKRETETVNGREYHFDKDGQGRVVRAEGPISNPNRIQNEQRDPAAQRRLSEGTGYHAGHLIGNQFGGPGGGNNLVLMCENLNLSSWKKMENKLVKLSKNNRVTVVVNVHYDGDSTIPSKFTVTAKVVDRKGNETTKRWTHKNC